MKTPKLFIAALADTCLPSVFNPYRDCCLVHDQPDAARVRKRNLIRFLEAALAVRVDTIWIARDLGYRGGRRTGVPLTDEIHLGQAGALLGGVALDRATRGPVVAERTAAIVWRVLNRIGEPAVLWNIFPLHPHEVRRSVFKSLPYPCGARATWPLLTALIAIIQPRRIVAIGRDAGLALSGIGIPVHTVRHPSYGGQAEFIAGVYGIYGTVDDGGHMETAELPLVGAHAANGGAPA